MIKEDLEFAAESLIVAMKLRQKYMYSALMPFNTTAERYLKVLDQKELSEEVAQDRSHAVLESVPGW